MNRKGKIPRFKQQRRLLTELPGLGKAGALERRPYPPGQHGGKRIKYSDYRLQLEEKQKIRIHYALREEQLIRIVKLAKTSAKGKWCDKLINLLERRLQNVVFRAGLAPSMAAAGQLISHGQILVNGKKVNIRSYVVKDTDQVSGTPKLFNNQIYLQSKGAPRLPLPDWLKKTESDTHVLIGLVNQPNLDSVPFAFEESLVTSFYSKV